ncbi:hypothetical protein [Serratia entomophila]|uniref:Sea24 n=1 Tax=Serratia entomophila TaxID=42906 RepID=A0ABY5CPY7_9GAMM|nr:hypothetical protein [Serratia entomophila]UIW16831.1 hypothetical protein KHA73_15430 [Serratia entomophila]USU99386.1 hypothetical protein KFQ06_15110 [Serratia entomophila]
MSILALEKTRYAGHEKEGLPPERRWRAGKNDRQIRGRFILRGRKMPRKMAERSEHGVFDIPDLAHKMKNIMAKRCPATLPGL